MENRHPHSGSFMKRWISMSSHAVSTFASYGGSEVDSRSTDSLSPPPLTDSSSTIYSSAAIQTPDASTVSMHSSSHFSVVKTPRTPPTRYTELPPVSIRRNVAFSLPPNAQRPLQVYKLHKLLTYGYPASFPLVWDIVLPPSLASIRQCPPGSLSTGAVQRHLIPSSHSYGPPQPIPEQDLSHYATTPPVRRMRIVSDLIPWSITVRGQSTLPDDRDSFIRVVDVLYAIYHSLRIGVSEEEWNPTPKGFRNKVKKAHRARCHVSLAYTLNGYEKKQGLRRVDWFGEATVFMGLKTPDGEGRPVTVGVAEECTWVMVVWPH